MAAQIYGDPTQMGEDIQTQLKKRVQASASLTPQSVPAPSPSADVPVSTTEPAAPPVALPPPAPAAPSPAAAPAYNKVATAPDGVPVYQNGANYYTQNPDQSYTQQFQGPGGAPDWLAPPAAGGDVTQALRQFYASRGVTPGDPGSGPTDLAYFAKRIQETGGMTPQNIQYWFGPTGRIAQELNGTVPPEQAAGSGAGAASTPAASPFTQQIRDILMQRLKAAQGPVDPNSPEIAQPFEAAKLQSDRGAQTANSIAAEQAYASAAKGGGGIDTGALARQGQQAAETQATGLAGIKSQLIQKAYAQKQTELQNDLQMALASGDAETARSIQVELANLQATLTREGYGIQLAGIQNTQNTLPFSLFG